MKRDRMVILLHVLGYAAIVVSIVLGFVFTAKGEEAFMNFLKEDGLIENLTALFLLASACVAVYRVIITSRSPGKIRMLTWGILALMFVFGAGEEISWGQRIFNFETTGFFKSNNLQQETNLHNLVIGGVKINKLIFSQMLMGFLAFYFVLLPVLVRKSAFVQKVVMLFGIPVPRWQHIIVALVSILVISRFPYLRSGELNEFVFSIMIFLIFLYPANIERFGPVLNH
jgi:hypothetical protein